MRLIFEEIYKNLSILKFILIFSNKIPKVLKLKNTINENKGVKLKLTKYTKLSGNLIIKIKYGNLIII